MTWRKANKFQVYALWPTVLLVVMLTDLRNAVWVVQFFSILALWLGALAAWRSDEHPPPEEGE